MANTKVVGPHVPCHYDCRFPRRSYHARLRARGSGGQAGGGAGGAFAPPGKQGGLGGGTSPNDPTVSDLLLRSGVWQPNLRTDLLLRNLLLVESTFKDGVVLSSASTCLIYDPNTMALICPVLAEIRYVCLRSICPSQNIVRHAAGT